MYDNIMLIRLLIEHKTRLRWVAFLLMQLWAVVARQTAEEHSLKDRLACAAIAALSFALPIAAQSDWTAYRHDAISTGGGLVFTAASDDQHFRAYEAATGKILWDIKIDG
jgi:hypothetical protein